MERDPILYAWRAAPAHHGAAVGLSVGLGGPLVLFALLCLRDLVDLLAAPSAGALPFLRLTLPLPGQLGSRLLIPGWSLGPAELTWAALLGLAVAALALAALGWIVARLCFTAQTRAAGSLRLSATDAVLRAPPNAREDVRALPQLLGQALSGMGSLPAVGILAPAVTLAAVTLALALAELAAPRLVPPVAVGLLAAGLARVLLLHRARARTALRRTESAVAERSLGDLIRRLPAVRAHGTGTFERRRLRLRALAARGTLARAEAALAYARAPALALVVLLPAILVAAALWRGEAGPEAADPVTPGALAAAAGAFALAASLVAIAARLWFLREAVAPTFREIAAILAGLEARRMKLGQRRLVAFPPGGDLVAAGVAAYDSATGERLGGVELSLPMPAHVAIVGGRGSGARALAAVLAGQLEPTAGTVAYAGFDLGSFDPAERARRIAFAGSEAILIEGTLKQNLLYGARPEDREAFLRGDRRAILKLTGLDGFVYARGLEGTIDPAAEPAAAAAIVAAREAVRSALDADGMSRLVEPFDPARYNHQATVGENILFGEAVGTAFSPARLSGHPYLRAVLEAEDLARPLAAIGLQVARSTVEIFADLPDDHPLFDAFSLFPAAERGFFEDLVARQPEARGWRRGPAGQRDRERLTGLALRYSETRHRFGLIDAAFEERLVGARRSFAALMPPHLRGGVEFYDPGRLTAAASLEENVLFGRITHGEAGAEARVRALVQRVLSEQGLDETVYRLGLASRVEPGAGGAGASLGEGAIGPRERIAIDLTRCLVRRPDILVVGPAPDDRSEEIRDRLARLRSARAGMGLIVCLPGTAGLDTQAPFDAVLSVERNTVVVHSPERSRATPEPVA